MTGTCRRTVFGISKIIFNTNKIFNINETFIKSQYSLIDIVNNYLRYNNICNNNNDNNNNTSNNNDNYVVVTKENACWWKS